MLILSVYLRSKLTAVLGLLVCIGYIQIIQVAKMRKTTASKTPVQFEISKILKQTDYQTAIATLNTGEKIYLNWQSKQPLLLNQFYQAELALRPISARSNIGNFDRQRWYFANHINMTATVRKVETLAKTDYSLRTNWLNKVKAETDACLRKALLALAFGERAWLKTEHWGQFNKPPLPI